MERVGRIKFDIEQLRRSKRAFRDRLAAQPVADKLRMLDALRARALSIRAAKAPPSSVVREQPPDHGKE